MPCNVGNAAEGVISVTYAAPSGQVSLACTPTTLYSLTVANAGTGSGRVTSSPAGIDCGATCSQSFLIGTTVTLDATSASTSAFAGWSGACTGLGTCTVTMTEARSVTATFAPTSTLSLEVISNESCFFWACERGGGDVFVSTANRIIDVCRVFEGGRNREYGFDKVITGTTATLTASPRYGATFAGWSGACTGTALTCTVTMDQNKSVSAAFNPPA